MRRMYTKKELRKEFEEFSNFSFKKLEKNESDDKWIFPIKYSNYSIVIINVKGYQDGDVIITRSQIRSGSVSLPDYNFGPDDQKQYTLKFTWNEGDGSPDMMWLVDENGNNVTKYKTAGYCGLKDKY